MLAVPVGGVYFFYQPKDYQDVAQLESHIFNNQSVQQKQRAGQMKKDLASLLSSQNEPEQQDKFRELLSKGKHRNQAKGRCGGVRGRV